MEASPNNSTETLSPSPSEAVTVPKSFDATGAQFAWDSTSLKNYQTCPRYYQLTNIQGWKPKGSSVHLWFGGHYASALENFYKLLAQGQSINDAQRQIVRELLEATWKRIEINGTVRGAPITFDDPNKTRETLIRSFIWYVEHFRDDPAQVVHLANGKPAVELSFSFQVDDDIIFCGHLDRVVEYAGETYVMDQKTSKQAVSSYYMRQYDLDVQMSMYTFATKAVFNLPAKGVIIDAAQIAPNFTNFERGFTFRSRAQLDEWYDETMHWIAQARADSQAGFFPKNTNSCGKFGGCEFRSVCSLDPAIRERSLKSDFEQRPRWDPLERR